MSTEPTPTSRTTPDWAMLALLALLAGGAVYALYDAFNAQSQLNTQLAKQNRELKARLTRLESVQQTSVRIDALRDLEKKLAASHAEIGQVTDRLAAVERTATAPTPTIAFRAPAMGDSVTLQRFLALREAVAEGRPYRTEWEAARSLPELDDVATSLDSTATDGVATEADLRESLVQWLEEHPATVTVEDPQFADFNARLKGLFTVRRKQAAPADPYDTLRAIAPHASLDMLMGEVAALPEDARAPLADWLARADARRNALRALDAVSQALADRAEAP